MSIKKRNSEIKQLKILTNNKINNRTIQLTNHNHIVQHLINNRLQMASKKVKINSNNPLTQ